MSVKCLIYCSKAKPNLYRPFEYDCFEQDETSGFYLSNNPMLKEDILLNSKIVASFDCEKVDYYQMEYYANNLFKNDIYIYNKIESEEWGYNCFNRVISNEYSDEEIANCKLIKKSCLSFDELGKYVCSKNEIDNFYAIHISNLEIFDEPKELYEYDIKPKPFKTFDGWSITNITYSCTKAPQNMCNVYDSERNHYVLISIKPEWVAKILNGEKTIEVRKKVVNKLKEMILDE